MELQNSEGDATCLEEDCNGVGHHQPSHVVNVEPTNNKMETEVDETGQISIHDPRCDFISEPGQNKCKETKTENANFTGAEKSCCHRRWTVREKYLMVICVLLSICCVAFVLIAFVRENDIRNICPCKGTHLLH